jgi:serine/threonine protein kinase
VAQERASEVDRAAIAFELYALQACAHHKLIVELLGASDVGADTYIAMERCEGDLTRFVTTPRQLSEASVAQMMCQVCVPQQRLPQPQRLGCCTA